MILPQLGSPTQREMPGHQQACLFWCNTMKRARSIECAVWIILNLSSTQENAQGDWRCLLGGCGLKIRCSPVRMCQEFISYAVYEHNDSYIPPKDSLKSKGQCVHWWACNRHYQSHTSPFGCVFPLCL